MSILARQEDWQWSLWACLEGCRQAKKNYSRFEEKFRCLSKLNRCSTNLQINHVPLTV